MLKYAFSLGTPVATLQAVLDFTVPNQNSLALTQMSLSVLITEPGPPAISRYISGLLQLRTTPPPILGPLGEVIQGTPLAPTLLFNTGFPFCTDLVPFKGCWPLPTNTSYRLQADPLAAPGYAYIAASNLTFFITIQFERL